jgi:hypothetical protein
MSCEKCKQAKHFAYCNKCTTKYCLQCEPDAHEPADHDCVYMCDECETKYAQHYCNNCEQYLCVECNQVIHNKGTRTKHERLEKSRVDKKPIAPPIIEPAPDFASKSINMHKNSAPFIPKPNWKPFYPSYAPTAFHGPTLSGYNIQNPWLRPQPPLDTSLYITSYQQLPSSNNELAVKLQLYLKSKAQIGEIIIQIDHLLNQLSKLDEWKNIKIDDIIKAGVAESIFCFNEVKYSKDKSINLISLKLKKISAECIFWVLKSLEKDEMTPTDRVIQSRIKESFSIKLQAMQWEDIVQVLMVASITLIRNTI